LGASFCCRRRERQREPEDYHDRPGASDCLFARLAIRLFSLGAIDFFVDALRFISLLQ
jgi:hypothetical protein